MRLYVVKNLRKKNWSKGTYIYRLIQQGKIKGYTNESGDLCYDISEYSKYKNKSNRGRPRKNYEIKD